MIDKIGFIVIALILFWCFNGLMLRWHNLHLPITPLKDIDAENRRQGLIEMWSTWWHRASLAIRVCLWLSVWLITSNWYIFIGVIIFDSIGYTIVINLINKWKWNYLGTTSKIDVLIKSIIAKAKKIILWVKQKIKSL